MSGRGLEGQECILGKSLEDVQNLTLKGSYSVLNLIAVNTNTRERSLYIGISGIVWGAGCILGPIIGGSFADSSATWRWVCCYPPD